MTGNALVFMIPSIAGGGYAAARRPAHRRLCAALDGLVLQGGADVSPLTYGEQPLRPDCGTAIACATSTKSTSCRNSSPAGKPVLGICRGLQLINVAFGGTLYQDIARAAQGARDSLRSGRVRPAFPRHTAQAGLARWHARYPGAGAARVNSIHHQAVKTLGKDLAVEAVVRAGRSRRGHTLAGPELCVGVQWHPEFHDPFDPGLLNGEPLLVDFLAAAEKSRVRPESEAKP